MAASAVNTLMGDSLFKTVFSGMVLREYEARRVFAPLVTTKPITRGKTLDFSLMGTVDPVYHTAGHNIIESSSPVYLKNAAQAKVNVNLNDRLVASTLVDELAELKNDFSARSELALEMGRALADRQDRLLAQAIIMAALGRRNSAASDTALYTGEPDKGGIMTVDDSGTDTATRTSLLDAIFKAARQLDLGNVPEDERYLTIHPKYFHFLAASTDAMNKDWGGTGAYADYKVPRIAGFQVLKSINIPNVDTDDEPDAGENNELEFTPTNMEDGSGNNGQLWGMCFHKSAAACAMAQDVRTEVEWKPEYQATFMLASQVMGCAALRRQSSVLLCAND